MIFLLGARPKALFLVVLTTFTLIASAKGSESSEWFDKFENHLQTFYQGDGFLNFDYRANDRISNDQADLIESCLYGYEMSKSMAFLDRAARLVDGVLTKFVDLDGDGRKGWDTARYSLNLIQNHTFGGVRILESHELVRSGFEVASLIDGTLPDGWSRSQATSDKVFRRVGAGVDGSAGVVLRTDGTNWVGLKSVLPTYTPGAFYYIEFDGWTKSNAVRPRPDIYYGATYMAVSIYDAFTSTPEQWDRVRLTFKAPEHSGETLVLKLGGSALTDGVEIRFDNVVYGEVTRSAPLFWETEGPRSAVEFEQSVVVLHSAPNSEIAGIHQVPFNPFVTNNTAYEPGIRYRVTIEAQVSDPSVSGRVEVFDENTQKLLGEGFCTSTNWSKTEFEFVAPLYPNHILRFRLFGPTTTENNSFCKFRLPAMQQFAGHIVDEGLTANALLRFANFVRKDPMANLRFSQKAETCLTVAREVAYSWEPYWVDHGNWGVYTIPDDGAQGQFAGRSLPLNQFAMAGLVWFGLFDATGESFALVRASQLAQAAKKLLYVDNGSYSWNYFEDLLPVPPRGILIGVREEDTAHGNLDMAFFLSAFRHHIVFDHVDIGLFLETFFKKMYRDATNPPQIALDVRGIRFGSGLAPVWWWSELAEFHPDILNAIVKSTEQSNKVNTGYPLHSELGVWYDQGWRILQKAMIAYYYQRREAGLLGPRLLIDIGLNGVVRVTWPAWLNSYQLKGKSTLNRNELWEPVGEVKTENGLLIHESLKSTNSNYYRLRKL